MVVVGVGVAVVVVFLISFSFVYIDRFHVQDIEKDKDFFKNHV